MKDALLEAIQSSLKNLSIHISHPVVLNHPSSLSFGDYSTNIAMILAKELKKNPFELAAEIASGIRKNEYIEKVEAVKPGFINIWINHTALLNETKCIFENNYKQLTKKKILLEFGQPNTHKLPHIGHLFSYIYGESMARIFEATGNTVYRANYQGDIGPHVAKCLYKVLQKKDEMSGLQTLAEKAQFLQVCYQEGSAAYEESTEEKQKIDEINKKLFVDDPSIYEIWRETAQWSIEYYKQLEQTLGIRYDRYYYETETGPIGKQIVEDHIGKVFEKSEGAIVFKAEQYGLHTRVFINKYGLPTYEAKDIGLFSLKTKEYTFDQSIVTTASEQNEYWRVVRKAQELIFPEYVGKINHIGFGMINLTTGKMSSRTGKILNAVSLIETVKDSIKTAFNITDEHLIEKIAVASIKYAFLRSDARSNMAFDIEKSISKDGDSGPYLLYTYVRCKSVLAHVEVETPEVLKELNSEEAAIIRSLYYFPEIIEKASAAYSPHLITNYLFGLAQTFNYFYQKHSILKSEEPIKKQRLFLTYATGHILKKGLEHLGIETVDKM